MSVIGRNGAWKAMTVGAISALTVSVGNQIASYAAYFQKSVTRTELAAMAEGAQDREKRLFHLERAVETRLRGIETSLDRLEGAVAALAKPGGRP